MWEKNKQLKFGNKFCRHWPTFLKQKKICFFFFHKKRKQGDDWAEYMKICFAKNKEKGLSKKFETKKQTSKSHSSSSIIAIAGAADSICSIIAIAGAADSTTKKT